MSLRLAVALTLLLMAANIVTFGGIGDLLFALGDGIANVIFGDSLGEIHGDYYWPIAIWMGLAWPVGALLIFYVMVRRQRGKRWSLWMYPLFPFFLLALDVGLSVVFHVGAASQSPAFDIEERQTLP